MLKPTVAFENTVETAILGQPQSGNTTIDLYSIWGVNKGLWDGGEGPADNSADRG